VESRPAEIGTSSGTASAGNDEGGRSPKIAVPSRSPDPVAQKGMPTWLRIGTFALGSALVLMASLVAAFTVNGTSTTSFSASLAVGLTLVVIAARGSSGSRFDSYAEDIRSRVESGQSTTWHVYVQPGGQANFETQEDTSQRPATRLSESLEKQESILREIYTQGLAQARVSFRISIIFASVGAGFLLIGIGLAIFNADSNGSKYASIVAGTAGVVVNLTSGVFFVQSNRARKNMGDQGMLLREESQEDRRLNAAREFAGSISSIKLRDEVQAQLALKILDAKANTSQTDPVAVDNGNDADVPNDREAEQPAG
jgi:hypothetical protein